MTNFAKGIQLYFSYLHHRLSEFLHSYFHRQVAETQLLNCGICGRRREDKREQRSGRGEWERNQEEGVEKPEEQTAHFTA